MPGPRRCSVGLPWKKWLPTYELRKDGDTGRWTWYLTEAFYRKLLEEALHYARTGNWPRLVGHLKTLGHLPMFGGFSGRSRTSAGGCRSSGETPTSGAPTGSGRAPLEKSPGGLAKAPLAASVYLYVDQGAHEGYRLGEAPQPYLPSLSTGNCRKASGSRGTSRGSKVTPRACGCEDDWTKRQRTL